jgi:hypothetical protein
MFRQSLTGMRLHCQSSMAPLWNLAPHATQRPRVLSEGPTTPKWLGIVRFDRSRRWILGFKGRH